MLENNEKFWEAILECRDDIPRPNNDFKELFMGLVRKNPLERMKMSEVKASKWYRGEKLK